MKSREITDKVYYLIKDWDKTPGFISYEIVADLTSQYGDEEQFNEYVIRLIAELSADRLVEYIVNSNEGDTPDKYFVKDKMIAAEYVWEKVTEGLFYKRVDKVSLIHTLSKENEYLKYSDELTEKRNGFEVTVYPYKELDFSVNNPQTVIDYITSDDYMINIWPEVVNPVCNISINPEYISTEELIEILKKFTRSTGRKLEVKI